MIYRKLSREMSDREVWMLMSMLVPGSTVTRIERLTDLNAIDVYFKRSGDENLMISFFPDELDEVPDHLKIENEKLYILYNVLNGYSTIWEHPENQDNRASEPTGFMEVLDQMLALREKQLLEGGELKELSEECGRLWDAISSHCISCGGELKELAVQMADLNSSLQSESRRSFYVRGMTDAVTLMQMLKGRN